MWRACRLHRRRDRLPAGDTRGPAITLEIEQFDSTRGSAPWAPGRPVDDLRLAFRGTAHLLRTVSQVADAALDAPEAGRGRRRVLATVAYDARGFARLAEQIRTGVTPARTFDSARDRADTIASGGALPARALRHLLEHSAVHLRTEWRDLPDVGWGAIGLDHRGRPLAVADTPWQRACQVWLGAIDLHAGAVLDDLPVEMRQRLADAPSAFDRPGG